MTVPRKSSLDRRHGFVPGDAFDVRVLDAIQLVCHPPSFYDGAATFEQRTTMVQQAADEVGLPLLWDLPVEDVSTPNVCIELVYPLVHGATCCFTSAKSIKEMPCTTKFLLGPEHVYLTVGDWLPAHAPTPGYNLGGVDRSRDRIRLAGLRYHGNGLPLREAAADLAHRACLEGASSDTLWLNRAHMGAVAAQFTEPCAFMGPCGPIAIRFSDAVPPDTGFLLQTDTWRRFRLLDGTVVLACQAPGYNARMTIDAPAHEPADTNQYQKGNDMQQQMMNQALNQALNQAQANQGLSWMCNGASSQASPKEIRVEVPVLPSRDQLAWLVWRTDPRVFDRAREVGDFMVDKPGAFAFDGGRFRAVLLKMWQRDEGGWRSEAEVRARDIHDRWNGDRPELDSAVAWSQGELPAPRGK